MKKIIKIPILQVKSLEPLDILVYLLYPIYAPPWDKARSQTQLPLLGMSEVQCSIRILNGDSRFLFSYSKMSQ